MPCSPLFRVRPGLRPNQNHGLTIYDAVSSHLTLTIMFWCAVIFVPLILGDTWWCYRAIRGP
jgi:cytochrome d ubiquinol oxidase subunit II